jgi:hypothetical protein
VAAVNVEVRVLCGGGSGRAGGGGRCRDLSPEWWLWEGSGVGACGGGGGERATKLVCVAAAVSRRHRWAV